VVQQDEFEKTGLRALLNLGHTFGHALEADGHYTTYLHGEAVAIGTLWACRYAHQLGQFDHVSDVEQVWHRLGLPTRAWGEHTAERLVTIMTQDKKNSARTDITLVLPHPPLGEATVSNGHPRDRLTDFLSYQLAGG
jgi:3-dehydroquinate synthase